MRPTPYTVWNEGNSNSVDAIMATVGRLRPLLIRNPVSYLWASNREYTMESSDYVSVTMDPEFSGSVALVTMQKPPVNSLCTNHFLELKKAFTDLENNDNVRAVIVTSGLPASGTFCAGLDFMNMYERTYDEIYAFWEILQDTIIKMYSTPLINIAAINGHCIAGGCEIAYGADYRIFADGCKIGLNEVKFGIPIPQKLTQMTQDLAGMRQTDKLQQLGTILKSSEALKLGLVDEVVAMEDVLPVAKRHIARWLEIPDEARAINKAGMRKSRIEMFIEKKKIDSRFYASLCSSSTVQDMLKKHVESLKNKTNLGKWS